MSEFTRDLSAALKIAKDCVKSDHKALSLFALRFEEGYSDALTFFAMIRSVGFDVAHVLRSYNNFLGKIWNYLNRASTALSLPTPSQTKVIKEHEAEQLAAGLGRVFGFLEFKLGIVAVFQGEYISATDVLSLIGVDQSITTLNSFSLSK